jgi:hypothetical protein
VAKVLEKAEQAELVSKDETPMYIGYQIIPHAEFPLFDVLAIVISISFNRLLGHLMLEFAYKGLLVFRPLAPISIVKVHRIIDKYNRSILIADVGWSAYHAEMLAINLKVASISNFDTVEVMVPMKDEKGVTALTSLKVPAGAMIFQMLSNWEVPKLQETIGSLTSTVEAIKHQKKVDFSSVATLAAEPQSVIDQATGGHGAGHHPLRWVKEHKKISVPLILIVSIVLIIVVGETLSAYLLHHP